MKTTEFKTFNTEGLTDLQINFLADLESEFYNGARVDLDLLKKVAEELTIEERKEVFEVWKYWSSSHYITMLERETLRQPAKLEDFLTECNPADHHALWMDDRNGETKKYYQLKDSKIESDLAWSLYPYLRKIDDRIYITYSSILSSTLYFVAKSK